MAKTKSNESKREKFVRLANARGNDALKKLGQLAKLANTSTYQYSQTDIDHISAAFIAKLSETCHALETGLAGTSATETPSFDVSKPEKVGK